MLREKRGIETKTRREEEKAEREKERDIGTQKYGQKYQRNSETERTSQCSYRNKKRKNGRRIRDTEKRKNLLGLIGATRLQMRGQGLKFAAMEMTRKGDNDSFSF